MNHGPGLTFRFLAAQVLVVVISLLVAAAVATMVGPTLFHDHMLMTGREDPSLELFHAEQAYRGANLITLVVALPTALICALLASLWLSRRLRTHYVVSSSTPGRRRFIACPPEWEGLCLCPFPPSERTVELVAGFGMAYSCPC